MEEVFRSSINGEYFPGHQRSVHFAGVPHSSLGTPAPIAEFGLAAHWVYKDQRKDFSGPPLEIRTPETVVNPPIIQVHMYACRTDVSWAGGVCLNLGQR